MYGTSLRGRPILGFRNLGWSVIGVISAYALSAVVIVAAGELLPLAGAAATASTATTGKTAAATATTGKTVAAATVGKTAAGGAEIVSLAAYRAMVSKPVVSQIAKAAGVLFVFGFPRIASAATSKRKVLISHPGAVLAVPVSAATTGGKVGIGQQVQYQDLPYRILGLVETR